MEKIILIDTNILALNKGKELHHKILNNIPISPFQENIDRAKNEVDQINQYINEKEKEGRVEIIPEIYFQTESFLNEIKKTLEAPIGKYISKLNSPQVKENNFENQKEFLLYERKLVQYDKLLKNKISQQKYNLGSETLFDLITGIEHTFKTSKEHQKYDFNADRKLAARSLYEIIIEKKEVEIISNDRDIFEVLNYTHAFLKKNIAQIKNYELIEYFLENPPTIINYKDREEKTKKYINPIHQKIKKEELNLYEKQKRQELNSFSKIVCKNLDRMIETYEEHNRIENKLQENINQYKNKERKPYHPTPIEEREGKIGFEYLRTLNKQ